MTQTTVLVILTLGLWLSVFLWCYDLDGQIRELRSRLGDFMFDDLVDKLDCRAEVRCNCWLGQPSPCPVHNDSEVDEVVAQEGLDNERP